jgi:protein MpaA
VSPRGPHTRRTPVPGVLLALALFPTLLVWPQTPTLAAGDRPAVIGKQVVGHSVRGRRIVAFHLGEPGKRKVVLIAVMHGNEPAPHRILIDLVNGPPVHGIDLWVVPVYNPDGLARDTRRNAHDVDLNRNYPYRWVRQYGSYNSGPRPRSEPETRAMMRFLADVRPSYILSFHQPLHAVDVTRRPRFSHEVARALGLPTSRLRCGGRCHGTMTMWFNHRFSGFALTVEYGARPSRHRMSVQAPRQLLDALRGQRPR